MPVNWFLPFSANAPFRGCDWVVGVGGGGSGGSGSRRSGGRCCRRQNRKIAAHTGTSRPQVSRTDYMYC